MDPLTHCALGAAVAHVACGKKLGRWALFVGAVAAGSPDLDMLLRPFSDPAAPYELHRHFTHSLAFVPFGALLACLPFLLARRLRREPRWLYLAALAGFATHAPLDCCTSWGTQLFWPFSATRIAWDWINVVDPVFSAPLGIGVLAACAARSRAPSVVALGLALLVMSYAALQHHRAAGLQAELAAARGHAIHRGRVMTTFGNTMIWRSLYESGDRLFCDNLRLPPLGTASLDEGESANVFRPGDLPQDHPDGEHIARSFAALAALADGYLAITPGDPDLIGDMRYSRTAGLMPFAGLAIDPDGKAPAVWRGPRVSHPRVLGYLWDAISSGSDFTPLPTR